jgi:uncharacterized protein
VKNKLAHFFSGFIFSIGLCISGMTRPEKVIGFLNFFKSWDPSLMFVMGGAISVHAVAYHFIMKRTAPLYSDVWSVSKKTKITLSLIIGSILFGAGWGLSGYCPGPAILSLASFQIKPLVFVLSMTAGMLAFSRFKRKQVIN